MLTLQNVFDISAIHLLRQKKKAIVGARCQYRTPDGCMCAVGPLIENYSTKLEGHSAWFVWGKGAMPSVPADARELITNLQMVHDTCNEGSWNHELLHVALRYKLSPEAVYQFMKA